VRASPGRRAGRSGKASFERLDTGLLVGADYRTIAGRVDVELDDRAHLDVEVGVCAPLPVGAAVGVEGCPFEDALDAALTDLGNPT